MNGEKFQTKKINDIVIKPVPIKHPDNRDVVGGDYLPIYSNTYICARKKSGKSTLIYNLIKQCTDKDSTVIVFCGTYTKDQNWIAIQEYLDKKKIPNMFYNSIVGEDGVDNLRVLIDHMKIDDDEEKKEEEEEEPPIVIFNDDHIKVTVRKKKKKKISQKYLIIFDDISSELKNPMVSLLLKTNRHYRSKCIISSQWLNDIQPQARRQIDVYMIFSGINEAKLEELYVNADLNVSFEQFVSLYKDSTDKPFSFFYVDSANCKYRRNFNLEYLLK